MGFCIRKNLELFYEESLTKLFAKTKLWLNVLFQASEGEDVFAVAHIFASFNDTFVHITDLSGK